MTIGGEERGTVAYGFRRIDPNRIDGIRNVINVYGSKRWLRIDRRIGANSEGESVRTVSAHGQIPNKSSFHVLQILLGRGVIAAIHVIIGAADNPWKRARHGNGRDPAYAPGGCRYRNSASLHGTRRSGKQAARCQAASSGQYRPVC